MYNEALPLEPDIVEYVIDGHSDCDVCGHWNLPVVELTITHACIDHVTRICDDCIELIHSLPTPTDQ